MCMIFYFHPAGRFAQLLKIQSRPFHVSSVRPWHLPDFALARFADRVYPWWIGPLVAGYGGDFY